MMTPQAPLHDFEALVRDGRREDALKQLALLCRSLEHGAALAETAAPDATRAASARLAGAIGMLFADPKLTLSRAGLDELLLRNRVIAAVFAAGGFDDAEHVLRARPKKRRDGANWLLRSLADLDETDFARLEKLKPDDALPIVVNLLTNRIAATHRAEANRARLIRMSARLADARTSPLHLESVVNAWMLCSYADAVDKHALKSNLAPILERYLTDHGVELTAPTPRPRERPVVAVLSERFEHGHAMFRCYAPSIRQLRRDFTVVLLSNRGQVDAHARDVVDEVVEFDFDLADPAKTVALVRSLAPNVVYYPSLGMASWTVLLSSIRLAPIQIMSLGHPATSRSPAIDYVVTEEDHAGEPSDYTEKLVLLPRGGHAFERNVDEPVTPRIREHASPVRIAVPANGLKLSARFLAACRRIQKEATRPVEFCFFPNLGGLALEQVRAAISRTLEAPTVLPPTDYRTYMDALNDCDLHLSPFPFGGTNSNVDTMRLGIPMVALDGALSAAAGEVKMLRRVGLADELVASDVDDYVSRALGIVEDDHRRVELGRRLLAADPEGIFCGGRDEVAPDAFVDAFRWIHEHHRTIAEDERQVWLPEDRDR